MKKLLAYIFLLGISSHVFATTVVTSKIKEVMVWHEYTGGAIVVKPYTNNVACAGGYWFKAPRNSDSVNMLTVVLSAFHAKSRVIFYGDESKNFSGLSSKQCELKLIRILQE